MINPSPVIACVQMISAATWADNRVAAERGIAQAAEGADIVVLPEYFCLMGRADTDKVAIAEEYGGNAPDHTMPIQQFLRAQAMRHGIYLIGGTLPLKCPSPNKVYNTLLVYAPDGTIQARYDKIHLFGFQNGSEQYDEGNTICAGELTQAAVVWDSPWGRVGLSICYDLRFPELYRMGGDVLAWVNVAAFTHTTGQAHWEVLLRARAIENQCYVVACGQGGKHENGRRTFGHSMIIDPWGVVQTVLDSGEGVVSAPLLPSRVSKVRASIPALQHRVL